VGGSRGGARKHAAWKKKKRVVSEGWSLARESVTWASIEVRIGRRGRRDLSTYAHVGVVLSQEAEVVPPLPRIGLSCFLL
jgi:hypothetical protein